MGAHRHISIAYGAHRHISIAYGAHCSYLVCKMALIVMSLTLAEAMGHVIIDSSGCTEVSAKTANLRGISKPHTGLPKAQRYQQTSARCRTPKSPEVSANLPQRYSKPQTTTGLPRVHRPRKMSRHSHTSAHCLPDTIRR